MRARLLAAAVDFWIKPAARSLLPRRKRAGLQRAVVEPREPTFSDRSALTGLRAEGHSYLNISTEIISRSLGCHSWSFSVFCERRA
jgi:hypothetical protein